jgi:hypothetical protein
MGMGDGETAGWGDGGNGETGHGETGKGGQGPREPKAPASPGLRSDEGATREGDASRGAGGEWGQ